MTPQEGYPPAPGPALAVSHHCTMDLHAFCQLDRTTCACTVCHQGPCTSCGAENLQKMYDGLCAGCARQAARERSSVAQTACDRCGRVGAFRNPATRRNEYLCVDCHKAAGDSLPLTSAVQGLIAACHGADVRDTRHEWAHVKGNTFGCMRCKIKNYDPELRARMRRGELNG